MRSKLLFTGLFIMGFFMACNQNTNDMNENKTNAVHDNLAMAGFQFFIENEIPYSFEEGVEKLKTIADKHTWRIPAVHDLQETMKKSEIDVLPVKVVALCHPKHASKILTGSDERIASPLMPCRVSVYQKNDGKTYVSRMNPAIISKIFDPKMAAAMQEAADEIEVILTILRYKC
jgi:uncharacterized protein (DUF302 family)